jgi:hypothetical protein
MKNAGIRGVSAIAMVVIVIGVSAANAGAEPAKPSSAFGAVSCRIGEVSPGNLGVPRKAGEPIAARRAGQSAVRTAAQVSRNDRANVTFEVRPAADGAIEVSGRSGGLEVKKTVHSSGDFVLELASGADRVTIAMNSQGMSIDRGGQTVDLPRNATNSERADAARRLLADSEALIRFRAVNATLIDANDRSPASLAFITSDALVGLLTGDVGAPRRIAQFLAQRGLSKVRNAAMAIDCFTTMETRMMEAWTDYQGCIVSTLGWSIYQDMCAWRWVVQVESYWFSFIACSGFNF